VGLVEAPAELKVRFWDF